MFGPRRRAQDIDLGGCKVVLCDIEVGLGRIDLAQPRLGVAAVMSALPVMIPLVIILMRKLKTSEVQL